MENKKCTRCNGYGFKMKLDGTTRADIITCPICNGDGVFRVEPEKIKREKIQLKDGSILMKRFA